MTHRTRARLVPKAHPTLAGLIACCLALGLIGIPRSAAQPGPAEGPPPDRVEQAERAGAGGPRLDRDALAERLAARLAQMDSTRTRLAELIAGLEAGKEIGEILEPEDRWLLGRDPRDGFGMPDNEPRRGRRPGVRPLDTEGAPSEPLSGDATRAGPERPGERELSAEDRAAIRGLIERHIPQMAERLRIAEETDAEAASRFFDRVAPRFRDLLELEREAPELVEVRVDEIRTGMAIVGAARELRRLGNDSTESAEFAEKKAEIRGLLARQIELRDTLERHRLAKMAADLAEATRRLDDQVKRRDALIDEHLSRVLQRTLDGDSERGPRGERRGPPGGKRPDDERP